MPLFCFASQSRPARIPASGPAKSGTVSATTVRPVSAKRLGSPLALMMIPVHCADSVASTRSSIDTPPISIRALSPPPMRRANPPASTRPSVGGWLVVMHRRFASMFGAFVLDEGELLVKHDAVLAGARNKTLATRQSDQRQVCLACEFDSPGGKPRSRNQDRDSHAHRLDHHFRSEPPCRVKDLVGSRHFFLEHPAGNLVYRVVASDIFHVHQGLFTPCQHAAVDGARFQIEGRCGVDFMREGVKPRGAQLSLRQ